MVNFLWLNIILPPTAVNGFVSLKLLEFGLLIMSICCLYSGMKVHQVQKKKYQMKIIFALKNSAL